MTTLSILAVGLLLGVKHATEADHLAAVATLATGQQSLRQTMQQGVAWGLGHTLTLMLFGGLVLWLGAAIPPRMAQGLEMAVGVMLVALGVDVLWRLRRQRIHFHSHGHSAGPRHAHAHTHAGEGAHALSLHAHPHRSRAPLRALAIGMMHGMAGSAALIVLSLGAVSTWSLGLVYMAIFGAGSIIGMALLSALIAVPLRWSAASLGSLHRAMTGAVGGFSLVLGGWMFYRIGVVEGALFG